MKVLIWCSECCEFHETRHPTEEEDPFLDRKNLWVDNCNHIVYTIKDD